MSQVRNVVAKAVSHPRVFEMQTVLLGGRRAAAALLPVARRATRGKVRGTVVDVGGGTASARSLWPEGWDYIGVDPDRRVVEHDPTGGAIRRLVGDAAQLSLLDHSVDVVLMKNVSHHLDDAAWIGALAEARRILKTDGCFVFVDAVWTRRRLPSRLAWALDAGRFPRVPEKLEGAIESSFDVETRQHLTQVHHSIMLTSRPLLLNGGPAGAA
ncbi:MAG TPA: class I SAM-dependent methyltransferase [Acidimicrobiales bacterium]|jgi:SAM-dependent methyltransferase